jgi:hypothetical protein
MHLEMQNVKGTNIQKINFFDRSMWTICLKITLECVEVNSNLSCKLILIAGTCTNNCGYQQNPSSANPLREERLVLIMSIRKGRQSTAHYIFKEFIEMLTLLPQHIRWSEYHGEANKGLLNCCNEIPS